MQGVVCDLQQHQDKYFKQVEEFEITPLVDDLNMDRQVEEDYRGMRWAFRLAKKREHVPQRCVGRKYVARS